MEKEVQDFLVSKIKSEYSEKKNTEFDELLKLDSMIKLPPVIQAYTCGIIGALITGSGMSLIMTDIGTNLGLTSPFVPGCIIGIMGLIICGANYPVYRKFLETRKKKYASEVLRLADKLSIKQPNNEV